MLISLATGAIIFDGLSQTQTYFDLFIVQSPLGTDPIIRDTITAIVFLGAIMLVVLGGGAAVDRACRCRGPVARGRGLPDCALPDIPARRRPAHRARHSTTRSCEAPTCCPATLASGSRRHSLPTSIVWTIQLAAVVGGHIVGAWAGHAVLTQDESRCRACPGASPVMRQLPLAVLMVCLTSVTLWSLGQAVIVTRPAD